MKLFALLPLLTSAQLFSGQLTWFEPQLVACEKLSFTQDSDMIVAMVYFFSNRINK